ncbi:hypothetical protein ACFLYK_04380, partial [Candidatus Cloacimonadota bacterium]
MFNFWKKKEFKTLVNFTSLVQEGANFVVIFSEDTYLTYEVLQYCYNWDKKFKEFNFFLPHYSCGFFRKTDCFTNASFHEISSDMKHFENSIILNLNSD